MSEKAARFYRPEVYGVLSAFTFGFIQLLVVSLLPSLAQSLALTPVQVTSAFTLGSVLFLVGPSVWGRISDHIGRARALGVGLLGLALSFGLLLLPTPASERSAMGLLLASRILHGLIASGLLAATLAWWRDQERSTAQMVSHSLALNCGRLFAPILVWAAAGKLDTLLLAAFVWCLLLAVPGLRARQGRRHASHTSTNELTKSLSLPLALALFVGLFIGYLHATFGWLLQQTFALEAAATSVLLAQVLFIMGALVVALQFTLRRFQQVPLSTLLWIGAFAWPVAAVALMTVSTLNSLWMAVIFLAIGIATLTPAQYALGGKGGRQAGLQITAQTLGLALGGVFGTCALQTHASLSLVMLVLALGTTAVCLTLTNRKECCA